LITCIVNIFFKCVEDEADNSEELIATDYNLELIEPFFFFLVLVNNVSQTIEINRVEVFSYLPPPPPPPPPQDLVHVIYYCLSIKDSLEWPNEHDKLLKTIHKANNNEATVLTKDYFNVTDQNKCYVCILFLHF
jgi:hypothetical protein